MAAKTKIILHRIISVVDLTPLLNQRRSRFSHDEETRHLSLSVRQTREIDLGFNLSVLDDRSLLAFSARVMGKMRSEWSFFI